MGDRSQLNDVGGLALEFTSRGNHCFLVAPQIVVEGDPHQPIADRLRDRAASRTAAISLSHLGQMQRNVMKNTQDTAFFHVRDKPLTFLESR